MRIHVFKKISPCKFIESVHGFAYVDFEILLFFPNSFKKNTNFQIPNPNHASILRQLPKVIPPKDKSMRVLYKL